MDRGQSYLIHHFEKNVKCSRRDLNPDNWLEINQEGMQAAANPLSLLSQVPLIQPEIPISLTTISIAVGSHVLFAPVSSRYMMRGFNLKLPLVVGLTTNLKSSVLRASSLRPLRLMRLSSIRYFSGSWTTTKPLGTVVSIFVS